MSYQKGLKNLSLVTDTDSFLVHIEGGSATQNGIEEVFRNNREHFDFASLETGHPLKDETNRQVPGKMKLQLPNAVIVETVVLSSKCYSVLTDRGSLSAMKGVPGSLQQDIYKDCIQSDKCYVGRIRASKIVGSPCTMFQQRDECCLQLTRKGFTFRQTSPLVMDTIDSAMFPIGDNRCIFLL